MGFNSLLLIVSFIFFRMPAERRSSPIRDRTRTRRTTWDRALSRTRTLDDNMNNISVRPQINNDNMTITNTASNGEHIWDP
jgi:hypothetical protein